MKVAILFTRTQQVCVKQCDSVAHGLETVLEVVKKLSYDPIDMIVQFDDDSLSKDIPNDMDARSLMGKQVRKENV